ncbi:LPS-assembly protein LptD [Inhella gelatinilytica]|uniref:LPS-assembly protein LptD n=1 Tax=Inhella gelatinilytica TaxID=2795030 RepID=A0A931IVH1_9BURK|nr:LPS assembly protein LptD [Inhella gelatinilytica]MBH9551745.1 LPS-assembly protein LptD [Inhella gelatinilytica]
MPSTLTLQRGPDRRPVPVPRTLSLLCAVFVFAAPEGQAARLSPIKTLAEREGGRGPVVLRAQRIDGALGKILKAEGEVELRHLETLLRAPSLQYDETRDEVRSPGPVELEHQGSRLKGVQLRLELEKFLGELIDPSYFIAQTGGSGVAKRMDFLGEQRMRAQDARYSSCPREDNPSPAWELHTERLDLDFQAHEGRAQGAVLRFQGIPILAAPALSFPLGDERKSGWLPPHFGADSRGGVELSVPYYFNLAPHYDATVTPFVMTRRGMGADVEGRWRGRSLQAEWVNSWLPNDRVAGTTRWSTRALVHGEVGAGWYTQGALERVSDDDYWKDLRRRVTSLTPRLLARDVQAERQWGWGETQLQAYGRVQGWQVAQTADVSTRIVAPYQREPQVGLRLRSHAEVNLLSGFVLPQQRPHLESVLELEYNRFTLPSRALATQQPGGERLHAVGDLSVPFGDAGWWLVPRLRVNAAQYRMLQPLADGRKKASQVIPSFSVDTGWVLERDSSLLGEAMRQSLEPRLLYVDTPYRAQDTLPNFDSAPRDFNVDSIYHVNEFTGIDRVADARQLAFGAVSRWTDPRDGEERLRLGVVQRYQFRTQRITGEVDGVNRNLSDVLVAGSAHLAAPWWVDAAMQFDPDKRRNVLSVVSGRYQPGPFRTVSLAYRLNRGLSEQLDLAWQWPLWGRGATAASGSSCSGAWYSAGRVQYSLRDRRITDSLVGVEYDAGCWVLRMGVERLSTGLAEANTRLLLQLELVGLSRFGSNALKVLRDNVPGYRPLASDNTP